MIFLALTVILTTTTLYQLPAPVAIALIVLGSIVVADLWTYAPIFEAFVQLASR
jgi:hypothetical protein